MLGVIGGSGLYQLDGLMVEDKLEVDTPFGKPSSPVILGRLEQAVDSTTATSNLSQVAFLPRHGSDHSIAPHGINYRANLWALKSIGVTHIIAVNAVGGIHADMGPNQLVVPDQIIDYTWGRQHTFSGTQDFPVLHVDFTEPYSTNIRQELLAAAKNCDIHCVDFGTYGATQGPRLESAAEVSRLQNDGCDLIGMTGMPEAGLARELNIEYASLCLVVNWCAGLDSAVITMDEINKVLDAGMTEIKRILEDVISQRSLS